jgi:hypothetical protein
MPTISIIPRKFRVVKEPLTGAEVYAKYKPDALINGGLYDTDTGSMLTRIIADGNSYGYMFSEFGIGSDGENVSMCTYKDSVRYFTGGSPTLIREGQEFINWGNTYSAYVDGTHYRACIGLKGNEVILYVSDEVESLKTAIRGLLVEKVEFAINLDGGGSCYLQYKDKIYRNSTRKNASWILLWGKERVKNNLDLVLHCEKALSEKWGYVFGTYGLILTDTILNQKIAQYPKNFSDDKISHINQYYIGKRTADCGGLVKSFLWWNGSNPVYTPSNDVSVNTMYDQATEKGVINSIPDIPGLIVWKDDHAGIYIGNGEVIEARGTVYGVVKTKLKDRSFTHWFKHKDIEYIVPSEQNDVEQNVSDWAKDGQKFVVDNKISDGLRPKDSVTREEMWTMLYRYKNNVKEV